MDRELQLSLYRAIYSTRRLDELEKEIANRGEAFFHVSTAGHEGIAALAPLLIDDDWLHCHYRDKALLLARGVSMQSYLEILLCKNNSPSAGRRMSPFLSDPQLNILSMTTPVANGALQAVGVAAAIKDKPTRPLVYCALGDGSTQQGEFLEACAEAVRGSLPVLFLVEDNQWAISTTTSGKTFYSHPEGDSNELFGMPIHRIDGRNPLPIHEQAGPIIGSIRKTRQPAVIVLSVERLGSHTNADDQRLYRGEEDIKRSHEIGDPLRILEQSLLQSGHSADELAALRGEVEAELTAAENAAFDGPEPEPVFTAKRQLPVELTHPSRERRGQAEGPQLTMREAIRDVLRSQLAADSRVSLFGEDIEDPKGDVFGVAKGLSTDFPDRVKNSPLTESTILGVSIGRALTGEKPVAFLQFADFLPPAYNQIVSELSTMYWRTAGKWDAPVIVMIACGAYRPGLGPFHSQTMESVMAHSPGLDVMMPSTAADAAGLLNAAFESGRPTLFFYPKSRLNDPQATTSADVEQQFIPIGPARKVRLGRDITFVGWGNTVKICEQAAAALDSVGIESEILDLRCISPWDEHSVLSSAEKTARLIVVHEDNHTCGLGGEVLATVAEKARVPVAMRRVARPDVFVPCNYENQIEVLPSFKKVLTTAAELLDFELAWKEEAKQEDGVFVLETIGSGPADETVIVAELLVEPGDSLQRGQPVAALEATKSVFEITTPVSGVLENIFAAEGEVLPVGQPLMKIRTPEESQRKKPLTQEPLKTPILTRKPPSTTVHLPRRNERRRRFDVGMSSITAVTGGRLVNNSELLQSDGKMSALDIFRRTGIENRQWAQQDETAVNMAVRACWQLLDKEQLLIDDLDLVICSTTSPNLATPSMACQILNGIGNGKTNAMLQAYDINAACSGYLYALQAGYDYLQSMPDGRVLVTTAEVLSPLLNPEDFDTAILFGDATSATILYGEGHYEKSQVKLHRPDLSAKGEDGSSLSVPLLHDGYIQMKGRKIFSEAVRSMIASLNRVCQIEGVAIDDLSMVVPHQANQRILDAIQNRIKPTVYSNIRHLGNTSSSSIPLCLKEVLPTVKKGDRLGLCAFGGGFTFGAGILESV